MERSNSHDENALQERISELERLQTDFSLLVSGRKVPMPVSDAAHVALYDVALEHAVSMRLLLQLDMARSAAALVRLALDVLARALWLEVCATSEQVRDYRDHDKLPTGVFYRKMVQDVVTHYRTSEPIEEGEVTAKMLEHVFGKWDTKDSDGKFVNQRYKEQNSLTHGGAYQINATVVETDSDVFFGRPMGVGPQMVTLSYAANVTAIGMMGLAVAWELGEEERFHEILEGMGSLGE